MNTNENKTDPSEEKPDCWKVTLATGFMWLLILLGIGGCIRLANIDADKPLISITTSK